MMTRSTVQVESARQPSPGHFVEVRAVSDPVATPARASQLSRWLLWKRANLRLCNAASQAQGALPVPVSLTFFLIYGFKLGNLKYYGLGSGSG